MSDRNRSTPSATPRQPKTPALAAPARAAFSLIEVLVATTLLVMIVVTVGMVFRQSMLSWDSGIQRADGSMLVRSVIGALERDLRAAVDGRAFPGADPAFVTKAMSISEDSATFVALIPSEDDGPREPTLIQIEAGSTVQRTATPLVYDGDGRWGLGTPATSTTLLSVDPNEPFEASLAFAWKSASSANDLPLWVSIEVELINHESFSGVSARSRGRDGRPNTKDDIVIR